VQSLHHGRKNNQSEKDANDFLMEMIYIFRFAFVSGKVAPQPICAMLGFTTS
jgi:hypothetical protein